MNQPADEVRAAMTHREVRFAAVDQGGRITAVLDRDTLNRRLAIPGRQLLVRDVVLPGMACLRADASPAAAARLLRVTGSAAVPVVDDHHFLGLVTAYALSTTAGRPGTLPAAAGRSVPDRRSVPRVDSMANNYGGFDD